MEMYNLTELNNYVPSTETITKACVELPNIGLMLALAFLVTTLVMFFVAKLPLKHKNDTMIRTILVNALFIVLCFLGIMFYYVITF